MRQHTALTRGSLQKLCVGCPCIFTVGPALNSQIVKAIEQYAALALTGLSAVVGQIVLLRELIVVFNGNEISVGIMLATWLFWTAVGSGVCSTLRLNARSPRQMTAALECLLAVSLPATTSGIACGKIRFCEHPRVNW